MSQNKLFKRTVIFELANNHMGDVSHGVKIIKQFSILKKKFNFNFIFKLQFRNLKNFIHKKYVKRLDLHYIKRFKETELTDTHFKILVKNIKKYGFKSMATPFDEDSVDLIKKLKIDFVKVASCSFNDWPLLEKISKINLPVVLSTAGCDLKTIDQVVTFLKNRKKIFSLLHCVGEYPTPNFSLQLSRIELLKNRYSNIPIGYSSHEDPNNFKNILLAVAKGSEVFEKHVGLETNKYKLNKYSMNFEQTLQWLQNLNYAYKVIGEKKIKENKQEIESLNQLKRGVYFKRNLNKNSIVCKKDVYFAFPASADQLKANDFSKYLSIKTKKNIKKDEGVNAKNSEIQNDRDKIYFILQKVKLFLKKNNFHIPDNIELEISHHYGVDLFFKFGLVMFTIVNREYCKKILILLPGQTHPTQYHKQKEETFNILSGNVDLYLNGKKKNYSLNEIITINKNIRHSFFSKKGCIIEEISNNHQKSDSFYIDKKITKNKNRKTILKYWS